MASLIKPKNNSKGSKLPQIIAVLVCCLSGISSGLLYAWTSPAIPTIVADKDRNISLEEASYFTIIFTTSMIIFALFAPLLEPFGRKLTIMLISIPQLLSWVTILMANNVWMFFISRAIAGLADAIFFAVVSIYVCEITEPNVRGVWGNAPAISNYLGMFLINIIGSYNNIEETAMICGCLPIIQIVLVWFLPESPYFLLMNNNDTEAKKSLQILRWKNNVEEELISLKGDVKRQLSERGTLKDLFTIRSNCRALLICAMLRTVQQFSGLPAFESYTQYMFQQAGTNISPKLSSIIFMALLAITVLISAYIVEWVGRRILMIVSCLGCGIILITLTVYFYVRQYSKFDLIQFSWMPLTDMLIFIIISSPGIGIIPTLIMGEIFSTSIKAKAFSVMNIVLAVGYITVPKLFQSLTENVGLYTPFLLFTCTCFIGAILSYLYLIETKGKTLEEIQQELKGNKLQNLEMGKQ